MTGKHMLRMEYLLLQLVVFCLEYGMQDCVP